MQKIALCMSIDRLSQTILLPDGRTLGYAESGDPDGHVLFHFHGLGSSRLEVEVASEKMAEVHIRFIGIDRPGIGLSSFGKHHKILDFVDDVVLLADRLKIERFSVQGVSAGAAYATACAYKVPHRVISCDLLSALGPVGLGTDEMGKGSRAFIFVVQNFPWLIRPIFWFAQGRFSQESTNSDKFLENIMFNLGDVDKKLLEDPSIKKILLETFQESYRTGTKGVAHDARLVFGRSWGFDLEDIRLDHISLWHGEEDLAVPLSMARSMAEKIPGASLKTYPNEGHLSLIFHHLDMIIDDIHSLQRITNNKSRNKIKYH